MPSHLYTGRAHGRVIMNKDPIVEEVRKSRQKHAAKFDYDLRRIFEDLRSRQKDSNHKIVSRPPKPYLKATGS